MRGKDLAQASCVCKSWNRLLQEDTVWRMRFQRVYRNSNLISLRDARMNWKDDYTQKCKWTFGEVSATMLIGLRSQTLHLHNSSLATTGVELPTRKASTVLLDTNTGKYVVDEFEEFKPSLCKHQNGWLIATENHAHSSRLLVWNLETQEKTVHFLNSQGTVSCLDFSGSPPRTVVTGSCHSKIRLWDIFRNECVMTILTIRKLIRHIIYFEEENTVVAAISRHSGTSIVVYSTATGEAIKVIPHFFIRLDFMACLGNKVITFSRGSIRGRVQLWEWETGECTRTMATETIGSACFAVNRRLIARACLRSITVWDLDSGQCLREINLSEILESLPQAQRPVVGTFSCLDFDAERIVCGFKNGVVLLLSLCSCSLSRQNSHARVIPVQQEWKAKPRISLFHAGCFSLLVVASVLSCVMKLR